MRTPKQDQIAASAQYYQYYAGYSDGFVQDTFRRLKLNTGELVLDPWNGAGTTTAAAAAVGLSATGVDVSPAAVLVARSRLLGQEVAGSLVPLAIDLCASAAEGPRFIRPDDMLLTWFGEGTASEIRSIERAVHRRLVSPDSRVYQGFDATLRQSALASAFYVMLFKVVRQQVQRYVPSNPTWIKIPTGRRLGVPRSELHSAFRAVTAELVNNLNTAPLLLTDPAAYTGDVKVVPGVSTALPMAADSVDAVVSSPPYCTRLDYVKATLPELAVLGLTASDVRKLRDRMIGTPTMVTGSGELQSTGWGAATEAFLKTVRAHPSRASRTYYLKYYLQYFDGMAQSLTELHRVLKPGRTAVLVVQDSYYKEVHLDLPGLLGEMGTQAGWSSWDRVDFKVPRTMASIHPGSRAYRTTFSAVESALILQK